MLLFLLLNTLSGLERFKRFQKPSIFHKQTNRSKLFSKVLSIMSLLIVYSESVAKRTPLNKVGISAPNGGVRF